MAMSREEFIALLSPAQLAFFSSAIKGGLALYADPNNYSPRALIDHSKAVRAQIRNTHIVNEARRLIAADPTLSIIEREIRRRVLFLVNARAYVSFKRLDDALRGHNYPTAQARRFNRQLWPTTEGLEVADNGDAAGNTLLRPSLWAPSVLPDMINIWAGYKPDRTETQFGYYIVCPDGDTNAWEWPLSESDIAELSATTRPSETDAAKKARRRVNVRPGLVKKQATDGSLE
jgi:hypothetical protein